jgi:hypothetical protein
MRFPRFSSDVSTGGQAQGAPDTINRPATGSNGLPAQVEAKQDTGYQWTALSVTTVGALLGSIQGSALLIALPNILAELRATFFTIMWVLLGYLLIVTVLTPIIGRLAD